MRADAQRSDLKLPLLPTTTIGPSRRPLKIRVLRQDWRAGRIDDQAYEAGIQAQIKDAIERQEAIGLDVLVHGEAERNDMVEYFGGAAGRLCHHPLWLGTELWLPLRQAAGDHP